MRVGRVGFTHVGVPIERGREVMINLRKGMYDWSEVLFTIWLVLCHYINVGPLVDFKRYIGGRMKQICGTDLDVKLMKTCYNYKKVCLTCVIV